MPIFDLESLKTEAKVLKRQLGQRGTELSLSLARDLIAQSAGAQDWNALYLNQSSKDDHGKRERLGFYRETFSLAVKRSQSLSAALVNNFPELNSNDGRQLIEEVVQRVLEPAFGVDDILRQQEQCQTCVITPSMMTASRWKGGVGVVGQGATRYTPVMLNWAIPWLREHGGIVFIRQHEVSTLLDALQSKTDLPVRVVDVTTAPSSVSGETFTPSTLHVPGMVKLATKHCYPDTLKALLFDVQTYDDFWSGRRQVFVCSLLSALDEYKRLFGHAGMIVDYFQLESLFHLAYDARLSPGSTEGLRNFLDSINCVKHVDGKPIFSPNNSSHELMGYITAVGRWVASIPSITELDASVPAVYLEELLTDRAITVFVAPNMERMLSVSRREYEYFTVIKNTVLSMFKQSEPQRRKETPLLIGAHDIALLCDRSPIHDLLIDIRRAGWGWFTQIPTIESFSGVDMQNERLLELVENTLQLPGFTLPLFGELGSDSYPRWRDQRQAQRLSLKLGKDGAQNPWFVTAKRYCETTECAVGLA